LQPEGGKMGSKAVVDALPPPILALFQPRPPLPYFKPIVKGKCRAMDGMAAYVDLFEDKAPPKGPPAETKEEKKKRKSKEAATRGEDKLAQAKAAWNPKEDHKDAGDAYKTLFVGRMSFETDEKAIRREFENYGPVKRVNFINDNEGKPRGYCFVEYERERDMRTAYKQADGRKIDGRRVVVDVERGRTVNNWLPRKLGGGLGGTRKGGKDQNQTFSGREPPAGGAGGGGGYDDRRSGGNDRRSSHGGGGGGDRDRDRDRDRDDRRDSRREDSRRDSRRDRSPRREDRDRDSRRRE